MKILCLLFLAASLLFVNNINASQESPELQEAATLTESVVKLFNQNKFDEALPLAKQALQIRDKLLPANDQRIETSLGYLSDLYFVSRNYDEAKKAYERLLKIQETIYGPTNLKLAFTLDRLAVLYNREGKPAKAEELYQRSLVLREKVLGPDSVLVADTLFDLGQLYRSRGDHRRALDSYKRALTTYVRIGGPKTAEFQRTSAALSCLAYESQNVQVLKELEDVQKEFITTGLPKPLERVIRKAISPPWPHYPAAARDLHLQGTVVVQVEINKEGKVISAEDLCQGPAYLSQAAVNAALKTRFSVTVVSGRPVMVKGVLLYRFVYN